MFLYQAMAAQKADWKDPPGPVTAITPDKARQAYLRAAVLASRRKLLPRQFPPLAIASWALAVAEVEKRPRGGLLVRGPVQRAHLRRRRTAEAGAEAGGQPDLRRSLGAGGGSRAAVPGRPRSAGEPSMEVTAPETAAAGAGRRPGRRRHARRQGAAYALVAEPRAGPAGHGRAAPGGGADDGGNRRDAATVPLADVGALETAVMRLEEAARRARLTDPAGRRDSPPALGDLRLEPVPPRPPTPGWARVSPRIRRAWARQRWPLLTAVGVAVGTTVRAGRPGRQRRRPLTDDERTMGARLDLALRQHC